MENTTTITTKLDLKISILNPNNISSDKIDIILKSKKFNDYVDSFDFEHTLVRSISILHCFMFGSNVGFVDLVVDCSLKDEESKKLPGYVFLRGKAVAILMIINEKYMLLTKQFRTPAGKFMIEAPAGMLDESGFVVGTAAKEIEEETGIKISLNDLISLGSIYPSPGGCDEEILLFYCKLTRSDRELEDILSKTYGEENSHEQISLALWELNKENIVKSQDAKLISAAFTYELLTKTLIN
jgi:ADP-sugar diphosphatase